MKKVKLLNIKGEELKDINLSDEVFAVEPNQVVVHDAIILARASMRQGTSSTKTVSEVSGGGRKPWRQKGTGHARQGSIRSVQWRGGGISFGPKPRDYDKKQNRKCRRLALKSVLTEVANDKNLIVVDNLTFETPKTKDFVEFMKKFELNDKKVVFVTNEFNENLILASRNLQNVMIMSSEEINVLDLVNVDKVVITIDALNKIEEVLK